mmetsp:Transcript_3600/g.7259  ORF Transcript_3600/g.7259 Transcript_3600/m.7259 type:complete len:258 (-) Transcript_3600:9-782(-)
MSWSFATLNVLDPPLMEALASASLPKISAFGSQSLGNTAWSYAPLKLPNAPLRDAISAASLRKISEFRPQELSNTAWAVASLALPHDPLREAIAAQSLRRSSEFAPRELRMLLWSLSGLRELQHAWLLFEREEVLDLPEYGGPCWQSLLAECEQRSLLDGEARLLGALADKSQRRLLGGEARLLGAVLGWAVQAAAGNALAMRMAEAGRTERALRYLGTADRRGQTDDVSRHISLACGTELGAEIAGSASGRRRAAP